LYHTVCYCATDLSHAWSSQSWRYILERYQTPCVVCLAT